MKKLFNLAAVAVIVMFVAVGCGGGSSEYKTAMKALKDYEKAINKAKNCEELQAAGDAFGKIIEELDENALSTEENNNLKEKTIDVMALGIKRTMVLCGDAFGELLNTDSDDTELEEIDLDDLLEGLDD